MKQNYLTKEELILIRFKELLLDTIDLQVWSLHPRVHKNTCDLKNTIFLKINNSILILIHNIPMNFSHPSILKLLIKLDRRKHNNLWKGLLLNHLVIKKWQFFNKSKITFDLNFFFQVLAKFNYGAKIDPNITIKIIKFFEYKWKEDKNNCI